jgi:hypothetical protein
VLIEIKLACMEYFIIRIFKVRASDDVHDVNVDTSFKEFKKCGIMYIPLDIVPTLNPNYKIKKDSYPNVLFALSTSVSVAHIVPLRLLSYFH